MSKEFISHETTVSLTNARENDAFPAAWIDNRVMHIYRYTLVARTREKKLKIQEFYFLHRKLQRQLAK